MLGIKVVITRYASANQPGFVECYLDDAHGRRWWFVEKVPVVSTEPLDARTDYPREGVIAGEVIGRASDAAIGAIVRFGTGSPWGVESVDGVAEFEVRAAALIEW